MQGERMISEDGRIKVLEKHRLRDRVRGTETATRKL